ncbi:Uncharacterised protein [Acinetobacter haemolyticus]|nr:Uncharacterised protein [Acinetobacter haemolyticus]
MSTIQSWTWDDSVSLVYKELFVDRILDGNIEMSDLERELEKRNTLSQPPGFKDKGKDLNASGDLIIWKEILKCAQEKGKDVIFISADEKNDWWHKSNKEGLYPRFELIDEFRRVTAGKSFHIISLSKLLKIFDASANVIQSVEETENNIADETSNIEKEYNDYLNYRRYLNIPKNHKIEVVDDGRNTKNRLDTDIYIIYEYDAEGGVIRKYKLYDSTHMDPPLIVSFMQKIYKI